jgi:glycosyltransferase involved in cell wall biosynthesis
MVAGIDSVPLGLASAGITGEIIAVDDGSKDKTGAILDALAAKEPRIRVIHHEKNQGYGLAIRTGCDAATMDAIAFVDSDGQFRISDLGILLKHLDQSDFATGRRRKRADSFMRNMLGKVLGGMNVVFLRLWVRDVNCGMKVFRRSIWPKIRPVHGIEKLFNTEMFLRLKLEKIPWTQADVPHYPRRAGNPTGAKWYVIRRMFTELRDIRKNVLK